MTTAQLWLSERLGYQFSDPALFDRALTHRSAPGRSNERLEYLGDAVLDVVVSDVLFHAFPDADEGDLSRLRAHLVRDASLSELARELGVGEHIALGSGEQKSGGHRRQSILADALEAIFGAVYLDAGFERARDVIHAAYGDRLVEFPALSDLKDPKTRLQEWLQSRGRGLPEYELVETSGKAHNQRFSVSCRVDDVAEEGTGTSRRNAEQQAAERMLEKLIS
ncbi:MAG: ribonuclease III [Pseudomonadota bacterium]